MAVTMRFLIKWPTPLLNVINIAGSGQHYCSCMNWESSRIYHSAALNARKKGKQCGFGSNNFSSTCHMLQSDNSTSRYNRPSPPNEDNKEGDNSIAQTAPNKKRGTEFWDSVRIFVKAGTGGRGMPDKGGIGGKGGDVIVVGHKNVTLQKLNQANSSKRFKAASGVDSKFFCLNGMPGKHTLIPVPIGVSVITEMGHKLGEINAHGQRLVIAHGGVGGTPSNGFFAEKGQAHNVQLDLKLIADVGFVGFPNAGKSTLLKAISRASPKIASYPFTTIRPNVGVMEYTDGRQISLADLPGLIEGAHSNIGMGHKFLKHVERTKILMFVVDIHGFQLGPQYRKRTALETIVLLNKELELYKEELTGKPAVLVLNKMDLPNSFEAIYKIKDTLCDQHSYEHYIQTLPEEYWPENVMLFDDVVPISAAKDMISVDQLRRKLRRLIDANHYIEENGNLELLPVSESER